VEREIRLIRFSTHASVLILMFLLTPLACSNSGSSANGDGGDSQDGVESTGGGETGFGMTGGEESVSEETGGFVGGGPLGGDTSPWRDDVADTGEAGDEDDSEETGEEPWDPCAADGECEPACEADPDCEVEKDPALCAEDGECNQKDCNVGEDPDCDLGGPTCVADGQCDPECWETDPDCGCEGLGIASSWSGTFDGEIPYAFAFGISDGTEDVEGNLSFQIECLASKYVVQGEMVGTEENGVPFSVMLSGIYDPFTQTLTALMLDGVVLLLPAIAEISFEGEFNGLLVLGDHFEGTWTGQSTGGASGALTATGAGTWAAYPQ
jgi:hypothetical protein